MFLNYGVSEKNEECVCVCARSTHTLSLGLEVTGRKYQRQLGNSPLTTQGRAPLWTTQPVGPERLQREMWGGFRGQRWKSNGKSTEENLFWEQLFRSFFALFSRFRWKEWHRWQIIPRGLSDPWQKREVMFWWAMVGFSFPLTFKVVSVIAS